MTMTSYEGLWSDTFDTVARITTVSLAAVVERVVKPDFQTVASDAAVDPTDFAAAWDIDPEMTMHMSNARRWVADQFYEGVLSLRALRFRAGLSQEALATLVGTSQAHISRLESGQKSGDLRVDTIRRLASALEVDIQTLDVTLLSQDQISSAEKAFEE